MTEAPAQSIEFGGLDIAFDDLVLRPRPWTVAQSRWAAELLGEVSAEGKVLELCSGAGHIGLLALALCAPHTPRLIAVDANAHACELARRNAAAAGLAAQVEVRPALLAEAVEADERFALVIADPPWVTTDLVPTLPDDPVLAIDGGPDGLDVAHDCIAVAERHLLSGGSLLLQLGTTEQADRIGEDLAARGSTLRLEETRSEPGGVLVHLFAR